MCGAQTQPPMIYHKIRVDNTLTPPIQPSYSAPDPSRTQVVYSGVSAGTWLSPLGMTATASYLQPPTPPPPPLPPASSMASSLCSQRGGVGTGVPAMSQECLHTLQQRARSANAVVGRRHFELGQQDLACNVVLKGNSIGSGCRTVKPLEMKADNGGRPRISTALNIRNRVRVLSASGQKSRPSSTTDPVHRQRCLKNQLQSLGIGTELLKESPHLVITPVLHYSQSQRADNTRRCASAKGQGHKVTLLGDDAVSFKSFQAMRDALEYRVKSAPPYAKRNSRPSPAIPSPCQDQHHQNAPEMSSSLPPPAAGLSAIRSMTRQCEPAPQRLIVPQHRFESNKTIHAGKPRHRCGLRPLMYSDDQEICHQCPSSCRGCFKACLASEDYAREEEARFKQSPSPGRKKAVSSKASRPTRPTRPTRARVHLKFVHKELPDGVQFLFAGRPDNAMVSQASGEQS